jgi:hypothetical protein
VYARHVTFDDRPRPQLQALKPGERPRV